MRYVCNLYMHVCNSDCTWANIIQMGLVHNSNAIRIRFHGHNVDVLCYIQK